MFYNMYDTLPLIIITILTLAQVSNCKLLISFRENRPCDAISGYVPFTTICKQKYVYRRMLALSVEGSVTFDTFLFPSGCSCSYIT